jgi:hypothetical protein
MDRACPGAFSMRPLRSRNVRKLDLYESNGRFEMTDLSPTIRQAVRNATLRRLEIGS